MKLKVKNLLFILMLLFIFVSCGKKEEVVVEETAVETLQIETSNGTLEVPKNPKKVVVIDYGVLDTLDALGVAENIELAIPLKSLPDSLSKYSNAIDSGTLQEPNFEVINEFQPDIIIIGGRTRKHYDELSKIAPTYLVSVDNNNYINETKNVISNLAEIFDKKDVAQEKLAKIDEAIAEVQNLSENSDKKVLVLLTNDGKISAYGQGSRFGFIFTDLKLKSADDNIEPSTHGQEVNFEYILEKNPDVIFYVDRAAAINSGTELGSTTLNNDLVNQTNAAKDGKIVALDSTSWYLVAGGLNSLYKQIEEIKNGY